MQSSAHKSRRGRRLGGLLLSLLHPDVIPLVLDYEAMIQFELRGQYGSGIGEQDGQMNGPQGLVVHKDELVVVDTGNDRIQVFHHPTGRFLRKWSVALSRAPECRHPVAAVVSVTQDGQEEIFVADLIRSEVQVFRYSDARFLRLLELELSFSPRTIVEVDDHIFMSGADPTECHVFRKSDGKCTRVIRIPTPNTGELGFVSNLFIEQVTNEIYVTDSRNHHIQVLDIASSRFLRDYRAEKLFHPHAVVVHGEDVIVSELMNSRLVVLDRQTGQQGRVLGPKFGCPWNPSTFTELCRPSSLAINAQNQLFLCDTGNRRVLKFE